MNNRQLFDTGIPFQEFYDTAQDRYKHYADQVISSLSLLETELPRVRKLNGHYDLLAVGMNWCIDSIINLPVFHWLEEHNKNLRLRVVDPEQYAGSAPDERILTPTVFLMDESGNFCGRWVQYPKPIREIMACGDQVRVILEKKKYRQGAYILDTLKEILDLLERCENSKDL